jgi:hypothetical protein
MSQPLIDPSSDKSWLCNIHQVIGACNKVDNRSLDING